MASAVTLPFSDNYTFVGDLSTVAICLVIYGLILFSYIRKTRSYRIFMFILPTLLCSAMVNVTTHSLLAFQGPTVLVRLLYCLFHAGLLTVFFFFTLYITEVTHLEPQKVKAAIVVSTIAWTVLVLLDVIHSLYNPEREGIARSFAEDSRLIFTIGYLFFAGMDVLMMISVRRRLYKQVMRGFYSSVAIAFTILLIQRLTGSGSSFTVITFLFPTIAMFYIMHSNPYHAETGTIDSSALEDFVRESHARKRPFLFMSLCLSAFDAEGKNLPEAIQSQVRRFSSDFFRGALLFQISNGHLLLIFRKSRNPDYEHRLERILKAFKDSHRLYQHDYKIVIGESIDQISEKNEYVSFIRSINRQMENNTIHRISQQDVADFDRSERILLQLEDIHRRHDLDDRRVLVYCQPVYNLQAGRYDTAEALMRLKLEDLGVVLPEQFIYLAEEHGYIHTLTEIILHKTCEEIRKLTNAGYCISRISVNVSTMELKNEHFCEDISAVISQSGIKGEKVAIELTESQSESDFNVMKDKIAELKERGITFYLDDFGTGYSNMERIIELPFDIIKFDRSLVVSSGNSDRSEKIVSNMASMFRDLNYSVLYEGVETDRDEALCKDMSAAYLQGFKYSRPIPIAELRRFIPKNKKQVG